MCSEDIPRGLVGLPEPSRRRFLSAAAAGGGVATLAAISSACTQDPPPSGDLAADEAIIANTYTGLAGRSEGLTIHKLIESSDASAPNNQLRGTHRLIWDVGTTEPYVALSFDDGPDPRWTPIVLEALDAADVKATFFMMGYNVDRHRDLAKQVRDGGHDIGNHTWSHQDLAFQDTDETRAQIEDGARALDEVLGVRTTYFRPPRGELSGAALRILAEHDYDTFLWSVSRDEPGVGTPTVVAEHIAERLRPGAIVDMHDSIGRGLFLNQDDKIVKLLKAKRDQDVRSVAEIIRRGKDAGLQFVTISELLASATNPGALSGSTPESVNLPEGPTTQVPRP